MTEKNNKIIDGDLGFELAKKEIEIPEQTLACWINEFVPYVDLFFFQTFKEVDVLLPDDVLVMPIEEFFSHQAYTSIELNNAYWYWNISKTVNFVCVLPPTVFPSLYDKKQILVIQQEIGRGLIFPTAEVDKAIKSLQFDPYLKELLTSYTFLFKDSSYTAFQRKMWEELPVNFKKQLLKVFSEEFIDEGVELQPKEWKEVAARFPHLVSSFNRFPEKGGGNCFASVLASISTNDYLADWIAREWVAQESLLIGLALKNYQVTSISKDNLLPHDVLLWRNDRGSIIHGAFYLGNELVFNKNGQQFFNPWQVLKLEVVLKNWESSQLEIWRKKFDMNKIKMKRASEDRGSFNFWQC